MNDFSHLKNKLLAEQIEDQIYHYILDTPQFIESVARMAPKRVVYVSCNPETMARDLALLTKKATARKASPRSICSRTVSISRWYAPCPDRNNGSKAADEAFRGPLAAKM